MVDFVALYWLLVPATPSNLFTDDLLTFHYVLFNRLEQNQGRGRVKTKTLLVYLSAHNLDQLLNFLLLNEKEIFSSTTATHEFVTLRGKQSNENNGLV